MPSQRGQGLPSADAREVVRLATCYVTNWPPVRVTVRVLGIEDRGVGTPWPQLSVVEP